MKRTLRIIMYCVSGLISLLIILFIGLLVQSPGKPRPFRDKTGLAVPGSIAVIETVKINGLDQKIIIRGYDTTKPVLLYLHGGPGSPEFPLVRECGSDIEEMFVVCYWEQRGAGLSYSGNIPPETMTVTQFVEDTREVSKFLLRRFHREKIYLLGHSWGTMLGSYTIHKYPEYYKAFIAIGQVARQEQAEEISYNFVLSKAIGLNDKKAIAALKLIGPPPYSNPEKSIDNMILERKYVTKYGGAIKNGNFYIIAVKSLFNCREYRLRDKVQYLKGMSFTLNFFWEQVMKADLFRDIPAQSIPVYIIQGTSDYQTAFSVAKEYFDSLQAPLKKFFPFNNSAHSPIFEEPEKFEEVLKQILSENEPAKL